MSNERDLCQDCANFKDCPFGEGDKLSPIVKQKDLDGLDCHDVVECNLHKKYPENRKEV